MSAASYPFDSIVRNSRSDMRVSKGLMSFTWHISSFEGKQTFLWYCSLLRLLDSLGIRLRITGGQKLILEETSSVVWQEHRRDDPALAALSAIGCCNLPTFFLETNAEACSKSWSEFRVKSQKVLLCAVKLPYTQCLYVVKSHDSSWGTHLFILVRVQVPVRVYDADKRIETHVVDRFWDYVAENHASWREKGVRPLYMTHRDLREDTSLIIDAESPDTLADFLMTHIAPFNGVRGIWTVNMARMKFFSVGLTRPRDFSRFTVTIDAIPKYQEKIGETISRFKPGRDVVISYIAHTFQSFNAGIMVSALAKSHNHMDAFVQKHIAHMEGVVNTDITRISRTMRLVSDKEWLASIGPNMVAPGSEPLEEVEIEDDSLISGC
jgi:hypothetical protein